MYVYNQSMLNGNDENWRLTSEHEHCGGFAGSVVSQQCGDVTFVHIDAQVVHSRSLLLVEFLKHYTATVNQPLL